MRVVETGDAAELDGWRARVQGAGVTGTQGTAVRTARAAVVTVATAGLVDVLHMPNGMMFIIRTWSLMVVVPGCGHLLDA